MICPKCNQTVEEGAKFCTNCGAALEEAVKQEPEQATEQEAEQVTEQEATQTVEENPVRETAAQMPEGTPVMTPANEQYEAPKKKTNGLAIAGLICSIVTPFNILALVLSIVGLVLGIKKWNSSGKGLAIAGIIVSVISLILDSVALTFIIAVIMSLITDAGAAGLL